MKQLSRLLFLIGFTLIAFMGFISSIPIITINSPQNVTYNTTKVILNVSSNEPVDFFIKDYRRGRNVILEENSTSLESYIYFKEGTYEFKVWANNSEGEANASIIFSTTAHNPIGITDCGYLYSSDAEYVLVNDISSIDGRRCLILFPLRNVSLDLNGYTVTGGINSGITIQSSSNIELFNGTINSSNLNPGSLSPSLELEGTKCNIHDLNIKGILGIAIVYLDKAYLENISITSTVGFWLADVTDTYLINSTITWNGYNTGIPERHSDYWPSTSAAFLDQSSHAELFLQETNITGFDYDFYLTGTYSDFYLRSTTINMSKIKYPNWVADTRFFKQHLIIINITDQFNLTGAGSIQVLDNGVLPRLEELPAKFETLSNPTSKIYIPTDETGVGQEWLNEKLVHAKSSSPVEITEYDFSPYNITAKSWNSNATVQLNLTAVNSTIPVSIQMVVPRAYPECTISQMLDLNNDDFVNIQDAVIVLRYISSLPVSSAGSKECTGINISPF